MLSPYPGSRPGQPLHPPPHGIGGNRKAFREYRAQRQPGTIGRTAQLLARFFPARLSRAPDLNVFDLLSVQRSEFGAYFFAVPAVSHWMPAACNPVLRS